MENRRFHQRGGCKDIREHKWFIGFDWQLLHDKKIVAPWVPEIKGDTDTSHFEPEDASDDSDTEEYTEDRSWCDMF